MKEKNYTIVGIISVILIILGAIINLIVHELSHYLVLKICNGSFVDAKIASESFVAGYIEQQYIAVVALASIYIPLFISLIMSIFKNMYVNTFCCGFTFPIFINVLFGLVVAVFEKNKIVRATYDIALAIDNCKFDWWIYLISIVSLFVVLFILIKNVKTFCKKI